jgi:hypothetical protein
LGWDERWSEFPYIQKRILLIFLFFLQFHHSNWFTISISILQFIFNLLWSYFHRFVLRLNRDFKLRSRLSYFTLIRYMVNFAQKTLLCFLASFADFFSFDMIVDCDFSRYLCTFLVRSYSEFLQMRLISENRRKWLIW